MHGPQGVAREHVQNPGEQGDERREVHVAERQVAPRLYVVELVAEVAVVGRDEHVRGEVHERKDQQEGDTSPPRPLLRCVPEKDGSCGISHR